ncbi:hypothetical protein EDB81DRAFT_437765 [Dactylonectria macrodidyma]|uniref:Uncharacterized protein n=1 Tax=Dactylonectria macrodidyma TaxID=307937 RepID=A0A9P9JAY2_9HYPO|nr:hypothetical protein EDB81DRAFT_437765 [Dactylonectria macrodidyma]
MPTDSEMRSRRDSWPPTMVRLQPTRSTPKAPLPSLDDIDNDPLTYFLTPAPDIDDDDMDIAIMDFDAGIQDDNQPREMIRSVSPSTLDGLRKPGLRPVSPDTCSDMTADDEDDDEDYIRFSPGRDSLLSLHDIFGDGTRPKSPAFGQSNNAHLSPSSPQLRGRTRGHGPARTTSSRRRPGKVWREPSPDVWSIEEETEEELMSDMGSSVAARSDVGDAEHERKTARAKRAAKPKKKVRFVLPA